MKKLTIYPSLIKHIEDKGNMWKVVSALSLFIFLTFTSSCSFYVHGSGFVSITDDKQATACVVTSIPLIVDSVITGVSLNKSDYMTTTIFGISSLFGSAALLGCVLSE